MGALASIALIYMDDIIISGNDPTLFASIISKLQAEFLIKTLGDLHCFLGIEVKQT